MGGQEGVDLRDDREEVLGCEGGFKGEEVGEEGSEGLEADETVDAVPLLIQ